MDPIQRFVQLFSRFPSLGPRQATRLAFHIASLGKGKIREIAETVNGLGSLATCTRCFRTFTPYAGGAICSICSDRTRFQRIIAIVEKETDFLSLEKSGKYKGVYLIIGTLPKTGDLGGEHALRLNSLKSYIIKDLGSRAEEIIIATNPNPHGDLVAGNITKDLQLLAKKITRLGRGIPTGGEIEFADEETLGNALERRN